MKRQLLYFSLAVLPSLFQSDSPPQSHWDWFKWAATALYQGLLALKALESLPKDAGTASVPLAAPGVPPGASPAADK